MVLGALLKWVSHKRRHLKLSFKEGTLINMEMRLVGEHAQSMGMKQSSSVLQCYLLKCVPLGTRSLINCNHFCHFCLFWCPFCKHSQEHLAKGILFSFCAHLLKANYNYCPKQPAFSQVPHGSHVRSRIGSWLRER